MGSGPDSEMNRYQVRIERFAKYPKEQALEYLALGLCSEAGEVAGKIKRTIRGDISLDKLDIVYELGDTLWYLARLASEMGFDLQTIADANVQKLDDRLHRNQITGTGDYR